MKKLYLLLLVPLLLATTCETDEVEYQVSPYANLEIKNNSSFDLIYIDNFNRLISIQSQSSSHIETKADLDISLLYPSEIINNNNFKLYKYEDEDLILVYTNSPIDDNLWIQVEPSPSVYEYTLTITNDLLE